MKARNLQILKDNKLRVPDFIVLDENTEIDIDALSGEAFAVRSSYEKEDGQSRSYAGQFDTVLNVKSQELAAAIEQVRKSKGQRDGAMRIIVQEMVMAEYSGVMFTANPMGLLNESVIVVGAGLGDNVVEDKVNTTTYYYNTDDRLYYYEQQENAATLEKEYIEQIIELGNRVKEIFGRDMDIEYAIAQGQLYILQARPITTMNYSKILVLDNSNIVESYPGISLPMTQSFVKDIYARIFEAMVRRLSQNEELVQAMKPVFADMVTSVNGRVYYEITNWYNVIGLLPFSKKLIRVWQEMLGVENKTVHTSFVNTNALSRLKLVGAFLKYLRVTPQEMDKLNNQFEGLYGRYMEQINQADSVERLLELHQEILDEIMPLWDITLVNDMYCFLNTYLAKKRHKDQISSIKNLESMRPVIELGRISEIVKEKGIDSQEYLEARGRYIDLFGDRCLEELKLETKTYRTNPELLDQYILSSNGAFPEAPEENTGRASFFVKRAKLGIKNREISRMNRTRLFGLMRMILLKIGQRFVEEGILPEKEDIFYLYLEEISEALREPAAVSESLAERKSLYRAYEEMPAYSRLVFGDKTFDKTMNNIKSDIISGEDQLKGIPSSGGRVSGQVLVIEQPDQSIDTSNRIIVTKMTDPGWVLLIKSSLGIIAEKGSMLSHTAIITRELKKPSVVNVRDASRILKTGDWVELDGDRGIIRIIDRSK